ncbi:MAG: hypothetical protein KI793_28625 [Rivularia sp. (in: Bacteria)]|nr:hypothetical protein [Rivularia sp. MS3]
MSYNSIGVCFTSPYISATPGFLFLISVYPDLNLITATFLQPSRIRDGGEWEEGREKGNKIAVVGWVKRSATQLGCWVARELHPTYEEASLALITYVVEYC